MEKLFSYLEGLKSAMLGEFAKLSTTQTELTDAKADLSKTKAALDTALDNSSDLATKLSASEASVTDLTAKLNTATEQAAKDSAALKDLTDKLAASEAKADKAHKDAQDAITSQGLGAGQLPAAGTPAGKSEWDTYAALVAEGKNAEASAFYSKNADKIIASRRK